MREWCTHAQRSQQDFARAAIEHYLHHEKVKGLNPWLQGHITPPKRYTQPAASAAQVDVPDDWDSTDVIRALRGDR